MYVSCDQRALFSPRFACAVSTHYHETFSVWKQVEYGRRSTLDAQEGRCVSGFRRLGTETGSGNGHSRLSDPDRNAALVARGLTQSRCIARNPRIRGASSVRNPDTVNMIYTAVSVGYTDTTTTTTMTGTISAGTISRAYLLLSHSKSTYLFIVL